MYICKHLNNGTEKMDKTRKGNGTDAQNSTGHLSDWVVVFLFFVYVSLLVARD